MKKTIAVMLVAIMLLALLPAASMAAQTATVVGGWLRLRALPNFEAATITSYYTGSVVTILDGPVNGFYHVRTGDSRTGYMYGSYLNFGSVGTSAYVTSANGLNVRMRVGPGTNYSIYDTYPVGTPVTVLQYGTYWSRVSIYGVTGYMMTQFLTSSTPTPTPTPTPICYATIWSENGYGVRLRSGAGTWYSIIGKYPVNTTVAVLKKGAEWDYIQVGTRKGWMMNHFLHYSDSYALSSVTINDYTPSVGDTLSILSITPSAATVSYKWKVNGVVKGTEATYTVAPEDAGKTIQLTVKGTGKYTGTISSAVTSIVAAATKVTTVVLNNYAPVVGSELVPTVTPTDALVTYEWYSDDTLVSKESTYTVDAADVGNKIYLKVTGVAPYTGTAKSSKTSAVVDIQPITSVTINNTTTGDATKIYAGDALEASVAPTSATVTYQWYKDGSEIAGATSSSYTTQDTDIGSKVSVTVTGSGLYKGTKTDTSVEIQKVLELPVITTAALTAAYKNTPYTCALSATSTTPVTWSIEESTKPEWLSISTDGTLSGTPTAEGYVSITVTATNADGFDTKNYLLTVNSEAPVGTPELDADDVSFSFKKNASVEAKVITIKNIGDADASDITLTLQGADASAFSLSDTSLSAIAAGDTNNSLTVSPVSDLAAGDYTASIVITYNTDKEITIAVTASVTDPVPALSADIASVEFGLFPADYESAGQKLLTVSNTGDGDGTGLSVTMLNSDNEVDVSGNFALELSSTTGIPAGDNLVITIRPTTGLASGTYTTTIVVACVGSNTVKVPVSIVIDAVTLSLMPLSMFEEEAPGLTPIELEPTEEETESVTIPEDEDISSVSPDSGSDSIQSIPDSDPVLPDATPEETVVITESISDDLPSEPTESEE